MPITRLNKDLQVDTTNRQILKIALPITLALLVPQINFVTNTIFLGGLGEAELAAAGITGVFYLIFALVGNGLNSGLQSLLARCAGENRPKALGEIFGQAIWISLVFAFACILLTYGLAPFFLKATLHSAVIQQQTIHFLMIRVWGLPFLYLFQSGNAFLVGSNNSRYMKYAFICEAALNIFFDYSLIYGHFGFPELGFNGAAVASVIAEIIAVIIIYGIIIYKRFHIHFDLFRQLRFNKPIASLFIRRSLPLIMQYLLSMLGWMVFYILIEHHGERSLAISNMMRNVFAVVGIFIWAFASTTNAMVSNVIGQGKKDKVIFLTYKITLFSVGFTAILGLLMNIFPDVFIRLFSSDETFIADAIPVIRIVTAGLLGMSVATVWLNAVTGTGNTKINLAIEIVAITIYCVYIWLVLRVWNLSLVWAWTSELLYWFVVFTFSFFYIKNGKWKSKII